MNPATQQLMMMLVTTVTGTVIGWLLNGFKTKAHQLHEKTEQERVEREQNRRALGLLMFYRLDDLHRRFVIDRKTASAADKQQIEDIYRIYHDELGLNGPGTHMYNEIMEAHQG